METLLFVTLIVLLWNTGGAVFRLFCRLVLLLLFLGTLHLLVSATAFWSIVAVIALSAVWQAASAIAEERRAHQEIRRRIEEHFRHPSWSCHVCHARIDPLIERCPSCDTALAGSPKQRMTQARAELERERRLAELACLEEMRHRSVPRHRGIC
ncbi:MAG: hypothetical protein D6757_04285 [Alphaproteobacteria bacterium]|nr:MAG: hypothetical protein D6757_04285 [Alphaproteobacteria bacterium]